VKELLRLLAYARRYAGQLAVSVVLMAVAGGGTGMMALLIGPLLYTVLDVHAPETRVKLYTVPVFQHTIYLDQLVPSSFHNIFSIMAFATLAVFITKGVCDYCANYLVNYVGFSAVTNLRNRVFDKVLRQGAEFFESHSTGKLMSAIMNDIDKVQLATSHILADLLRQTFTLLALLAVVIGTDWKLALLSLLLVPLVIFPVTTIGKRIRRTTRRTQDNQGDLSQVLQETLSGHMVVKAFNAEGYESRRFHDAAHLLEPVKRLVGIHNIFEQALGASQKVFEYLDNIEKIAEKPGAKRIERFSQRVVFDNVGFHYPSVEGGFRIQGLSLTVEAGEMVALVGPSGGGKTTLANLVPRFYDVTAGAVKMDGHDVRDLELDRCGRRSASWRRTLSCSTTRWPAISPTAGRTRRPPKSAARPKPRWRTSSYRAAAGGLSDGDRRPRRALERRPAAAHRHRARAAEERAHPDSRRSHLASGHRIGNAGAEGAGQSDGAPHGDRDRAPAVHHPPRRQDRGHRAGPPARNGNPRGTARMDEIRARRRPAFLKRLREKLADLLQRRGCRPAAAGAGSRDPGRPQRYRRGTGPPAHPRRAARRDSRRPRRSGQTPRFSAAGDEPRSQYRAVEDRRPGRSGFDHHRAGAGGEIGSR
jgi:ATP-binding cassette, subfamily B, bacterial MsbA